MKQSVSDNADNEEFLKCLIEIAEIAPEFLESILDQLIAFCISVMCNVDVMDSCKHLALEVILTLAENASDMVKKNSDKIPLIGK